MMKKKQIEKKLFNQWGQIEVEKVFGLKEIYESSVLEEWLSAKSELTAFEEESLDLLRKKAQIYISVWNETDYTANFISDAIAQTLLAMLFAQQENNQSITYGGYINGRKLVFHDFKRQRIRH